MKKSITLVLAMMSMMVFAQTPRAFYNQVSSYPTAEAAIRASAQSKGCGLSTSAQSIGRNF